MLAANVLCLKKKKKRTYCVSNVSNFKGNGAATSKNERSRGSAVTMMQITEDTPPDMLAGAMDLTVHLPNGSAVKMSVERSTPMMDLLVQITTANHLQLSNHTLQVLGMAPSSEHNDKILPFKPNTPVGALDTQHIRVLLKGRTLPAPKFTAPGHQPFESTFRLKVHLPRNQLYVTRVSRNVLLEDIMKKVCEEKNLDPVKYEFKHPGNLDQVLDPKLTLSDYQITEIYVVIKGTTNLSQAFSAADIMVLRKEEERKQMHTKTGGGVFNLIFKRGKSSMGSGSVSSENRSISPTHSDDSRSVTPPAVQAPTIVAPPKKEPPLDRPKPPQRKRRPAPKPPQIEVAEVSNENSVEKNSSVVSNEVPSNHSSQKSSENGLTICHSRNSSDSSGYHEASILSDHCANTSLPRTRPKSAFVGGQVPLQSTSNLSKMSAHSQSTTSLMTGRKKKAAPLPPPVPVSPANSVVAQSEKPSPLVASQSEISANQESSSVLETTLTPIINPVPKPRSRTKTPQVPPRLRPSSETFTSIEEYSLSGSSSSLNSNEDFLKKVKIDVNKRMGIKEDEFKTALNKNVVESVLNESLGLVSNVSLKNSANNQSENNLFKVERRRPIMKDDIVKSINDRTIDISFNTKAISHINNNSLECSSKHSKENKLEFDLEQEHLKNSEQKASTIIFSNSKIPNADFSVEDMLVSLEAINSFTQEKEEENINSIKNAVQDKDTITINSPNSLIFDAQKSVISNIFTTEEFLKESKRPEIVGVIPKTSQEDKKYASATTSLEQINNISVSKMALERNDEFERASISSKRSVESKSSRNSIVSALNALDDEISDLDENIFTGSLSKASTKNEPEVLNQLFGMHEYDSETEKRFRRNISVGSLRSVNSLPGFDGATTMKKWDNSEELDSVSLNYYGVRNKWVAGDTSDTESVVSSNLTPFQTSRDNKISFPLKSSTPVRTQSEEKSLESTDSGISQDTSHRKEDEERLGLYTPPPPPILDETEQDEISSVKSKRKLISSPIDGQEKLTEIIRPTIKTLNDDCINIFSKNEPKIELNKTEDISVKPVSPKTSIILPSPVQIPSIPSDAKKLEPVLSTKTVKQSQSETELGDIDWQYQLPSPPKAFRDSSPEHLNLNETISVTNFKDSVVTSPELFEKLKSLEDNQFEKDTLKSEVTSVASEEPLNMLSLEHLEKRKSLVYNRELATSLKLTDNVEPSIKATDNFTSAVNNFQSTFDELNKSIVQQNQPRKPARTTVTSSHHHTLPNFKISTYDVPKHNITVFEDDTIRSNTHASSNLTKTNLGRSMDNISFVKKTSAEESSIHPNREYKFYGPQTTNLGTFGTLAVSRSESFSADHRSPFKPVSRSKSTLTVNKPQISQITETSISRSNSLFDVSGLQSLEVMKLIQNKLNTPTGSLENISYRERTQNQHVPQKLLPQDETKEIEAPIVSEPVEEKQHKPSPQPVKKYYYRGPPAVNMTTWSERPKVPVSVKEDKDYTLGNANISSKLIVNTTNNNIISNNSIEVQNNGFGKSSIYLKEPENRNVSVKVNGTGQISQPFNNVVIKVGGEHNNNYTKNLDNRRFLGPMAYRKPFSNINRNGNSIPTNQRPHSIALPSDFDISRVPVVRSVEFKKHFKDFHGSNTSITHINHGTEDFGSLHQNSDISESFVEKFRSTENLKSPEQQENEPNKRVFRVASFKPLDNYSAPIIRGFRPTDRDINHRISWNPSSNYNTLPAKPKGEKEYTTNQHVPFSQSTLKRTSSSKIYTADQNYNDISKPVLKPDKSYVEEDNSYNSLPATISLNKFKITSGPPPPPEMPKIALKKVLPREVRSEANTSDPRDMLLDSIRKFGGKKGLKAVKA